MSNWEEFYTNLNVSKYYEAINEAKMSRLLHSGDTSKMTYQGYLIEYKVIEKLPEPLHVGVGSVKVRSK